MPVTSRSLRRNGNHSISTRASAAVLASIIGAAGAAWAIGTVFDPYHGNFAKSSDDFPEESTAAPMVPTVFALPTVGAPAEDVSAGSPSAYRSDTSLLRVADSLNTAATPPSDGSETGGSGGGGNGGGGNWLLPGPGRTIDLPRGGGDDGDDESPLLARPDITMPGGDGAPVACAAEAIAAVESSDESALIPGRVVDEAVPSQCEETAEAPAEEAPAEEAPADESPAEDSTSSVA